MTTGIGVIGCGARIRQVLGMIPGINRRFRVVAVCDPDARSLRAMREEFKPEATVYRCHEEVARDPRVKWVFIGSWNSQHRDHAVVALEAGKHVFCEKPLATTFADCVAMKRARDKSGRMFGVGFTLRYSPHYRRIKELVASGAIGKLVSMEFNETLHFDHGGFIHGDWRRLTANAGSHLLEKCCHDMDLAHWIVASLPVRAASFGGTNFFVPENRKVARRLGRGPHGGVAFADWPGLVNANPFTADKDIVDNQVAILEFANGVRATFHTNCATNMPERRMYLCGTEGTLRADVVSGTIEMIRFGYDEKVRRLNAGVQGGHGGGDTFLGRELGDAMGRGIPPPTTLEDGLAAAVICFGIDQAMETGRVVDLRRMWKKAGVKV